jgi:hypothetical protein
MKLKHFNNQNVHSGLVALYNTKFETVAESRKFRKLKTVYETEMGELKTLITDLKDKISVGDKDTIAQVMEYIEKDVEVDLLPMSLLDRVKEISPAEYDAVEPFFEKSLN